MPLGTVYAEFPCDLAQMKQKNSGSLPKIYLSFEQDHYDYYVCSVRDSIEQLAQANKFPAFVASERTFFVEGSSLLTRRYAGIEDELLFNLAGLTYNLNILGMSSFKQQLGIKNGLFAGPVDRMEIFAGELRDYPLLRALWNSFLEAGGLSQGQSELAQTLTEWADALSKNVSPEQAERDVFLFRSKILNKLESLKEVYSLFAKFVFKRYNDEFRYSRYPFLKLEPISFEAVTTVDGVDQVVFSNRDPVFAHALERLYCEAAAQKLPLFVTLGQGHVEGVRQLLLASSNQEIEVVDSDPIDVLKRLFSAKNGEETDRILSQEYPFMKEHSSKKLFVRTVLNAARYYQENSEQKESSGMIHIPAKEKEGLNIFLPPAPPLEGSSWTILGWVKNLW